MIYNLKIQRYAEQLQITHYTYKIKRSNDKSEDIKSDIKHYKQYIESDCWGNTIALDISEDKVNIANKYIFISNKTPLQDIEKLYKAHNKIVRYNNKITRSEREKKMNKDRSLRNTIQRIYEYARSNNWEWFGTITIADKETRYEYEKCLTMLHNWLQNQKKKNAPELKYIVVPERHKDGAYHFHCLLSEIGKMQIEKSINSKNGKLLKDNKGRQIYNVKSYRGGFTTLTPVTDTNRVSVYITKYVTKDMIDLDNKKRYLCSNNLKKADVKYLEVESFREIADVLDSAIGYSPEIKTCKTIKNPTMTDAYINIMQADREKEVEKW